MTPRCRRRSRSPRRGPGGGAEQRRPSCRRSQRRRARRGGRRQGDTDRHRRRRGRPARSCAKWTAQHGRASRRTGRRVPSGRPARWRNQDRVAGAAVRHGSGRLSNAPGTAFAPHSGQGTFGPHPGPSGPRPPQGRGGNVKDACPDVARRNDDEQRFRPSAIRGGRGRHRWFGRCRFRTPVGGR